MKYSESLTVTNLISSRSVVIITGLFPIYVLKEEKDVFLVNNSG